MQSSLTQTQTEGMSDSTAMMLSLLVVILSVTLVNLIRCCKRKFNVPVEHDDEVDDGYEPDDEHEDYEPEVDEPEVDEPEVDEPDVDEDEVEEDIGQMLDNMINETVIEDIQRMNDHITQLANDGGFLNKENNRRLNFEAKSHLDFFKIIKGIHSRNDEHVSMIDDAIKFLELIVIATDYIFYQI